MNTNISLQTSRQTVTSTSTLFGLSSYNAVVMDYMAKNGSNLRAGTVVGVWDGSNSKLTETTTTDLGDTTAVSFSVSNNGTVSATVSSGTWTITGFARALS
jgi:hypothetical protein